jgi:uncharacterized iron-regulated membrane protein
MKKIIHQIHLVLGLASGLVVLVVSLTGCLYVFEEEVRDWTQAHYLYVRPESRVKLPVSEAVALAQQAFPGEKVTQVRWKTGPEHALLVRTQRNQLISLNPYSGAVLGVRDMDTDFLSVVEHLHTSLLLGSVGKEIVRWNVLIFFVLLISGLVLWFPANAKFLRQAFALRWTGRWRKLNYDFHRIGGFYLAWVLLPIALSGIWWGFDSAKDFVYWATGSPARYRDKVVSAPPRASSPWRPVRYVAAQPSGSTPPEKARLQHCFDQAAALAPGYRQAFVSLPQDSLATIRVLFRYPYTSLVRDQSQFHFDQYTGQLLRADPYQAYSVADKVRSSNYDLHTGRMFGLGGKVLAFLASLFAASLPITGFWVWWGKRRPRK